MRPTFLIAGHCLMLHLRFVVFSGMLICLLGAATIPAAHAVVIFSEDFEDITLTTDPLPLATNTGNSAFTSNVTTDSKSIVAVRTDDLDRFGQGAGNKILHLVDGSEITAGLRGPVIPTSNSAIHLSFDFFDPLTTITPIEPEGEVITSGSRVFLHDTNTSGAQSTRSLDFRFNRELLGYTTSSGTFYVGTYSGNQLIEVDVFANYSNELVSYHFGGSERTLAPKTYDIFLNGAIGYNPETDLYASGLSFRNEAATSVTHIGFTGFGNPNVSEGFFDDILITTDLPSALQLIIDRNTGEAILKNFSEGSVTLLGYEIFSNKGALDTVGWNPISGNYDAGSPGEIDPDDKWTILTNTSIDHTNSLAEYVFPGAGQANNGITLGAGQQINFGQAWIPTHDEGDLSLVVHNTAGGQSTVPIFYVGNGGKPLAMGDLNHDGVVDAADWLIFNSNDPSDDLSFTSIARAYGMGDLDGDLDIDTLDYRLFEAAYNAANGAGSFLAMLNQGQPVPEPSTLLVAALGLPLALTLRRSRTALRLCLLGLAVVWSFGSQAPAQSVVFDFRNNSELDDTPLGSTMSRSPDEGPFNVITMKTTDARAPIYANADLDWDGVSYHTTVSHIPSAHGILIRNPGEHVPPQDTTGFNPYESLSFEFDRYVRILEFDFASLNEAEGDQGEVSVEGLVSPILFNYATLSGGSANLMINPFGDLIIPAGADITLTGLESYNGGTSAWRLVTMTVEEVFPRMTARVNAQTGEVLLTNTGEIPLAFDSYELRSGDAALKIGNGDWNSLSDQGRDTMGGGIGESWDEGGNVNASIVAERFLLGETALAPGEFVSLGNLFDLEIGSIENLSFFFSDKQTHALNGLVELFAPQDLPGDFNGDGVVDAADYTVWRNNLGGDDAVLGGNGHTNGVVDTEDYLVWKDNFGKAAGAGAIELAATQVPEPSSVALIGLAACGMLCWTRRRRLAASPAAVAALMVVALAGATTAQAITIDRYYPMGDYSGTHYEGQTPSNGPEGAVVQSSWPGYDVLDAESAGGDADLVKGNPDGPIYAGVGPEGNFPRAGASGFAIEFNGTTDYLRSDSPLNIIHTNGDTPTVTQGLQMWVYVKPDKLGVGRQALISDTLNTGGPVITASGLWSQNFSNHPLDSHIEATVPVIPNVWHHVAQHIYLNSDANAPTVIPGSGDAPHLYTSVVYVNGVAVSASNDSSTGEGNGEFVIGAEGSTPTNYFSGVIDELTIYTSGPNEFNLLEHNDFVVDFLPQDYKPGDIDFDGVVGPSDVEAFVDGWRKEKRLNSFHNSVWIGDLETLGWGDINLDGRVDLADAFLLNQALLDSGAGGLDFSLLSGGAAVPEPASVALLLVAALAGAAALKRRPA